MATWKPSTKQSELGSGRMGWACSDRGALGRKASDAAHARHSGKSRDRSRSIRSAAALTLLAIQEVGVE
jgi:hypothetical protein